MTDLKISDIVTQLEAFLRKKLDKAFQDRLIKNILDALHNKAKPIIFTEFIKQYDILAAQEKSEFGVAAKGKDPSALEEFRDLFVEQISKELESIRIEGDSIVIEVGNKDLWGYGRSDTPEGQPQSVDFLVYYIEGVVGEFGFLSLEHYQKRRRKVSKVGRFGKGFLISKEDYQKEHWERITKIKFDEIRHPISGQPGFKGFDSIASALDLSLFVQEAAQKTFVEML